MNTRAMYDQQHLLRFISRSAILVNLLLLTIATHPTPTLAQVEGSITLSSESNVHVCTIRDWAPGVRTVYVLHRFNVGATASRFRVQTGPGATLTYVSEQHHFASTFGNTQDGISICYGACSVGDLLLATITYLGYGTSSNCSEIRVVPHPLAQTVEAIACEGNPVRASIRDLAIYPVNGGCGCPPAESYPGSPQVFSCVPVPVASSTWGAIKAMYR